MKLRNKYILLISIVVCIAGVGLLLSYRDANSELTDKLTLLENKYASQQSELSAAKGHEKASQARIVALETQVRSIGKSEPPETKTAHVDDKTVPVDPEHAIRLTKLRRQYGEFIKQRGMPEADAERLFSVLAEREAVNSDVQTQIREAGLTDSASVEAFREKLQNAISKNIESLLGYKGATELSAYEQQTFYREAYVAPLVENLGTGVPPMTPAQIANLTEIVLKNDHPYKKDPSDLTMESNVDWSTVVASASQFLTPTQLAALQKGTGRFGPHH